MSKPDTEAIEALDLDRRWDALNAADPAIRQFDRRDQELRELVESDDAEPPSLQFVAELWSNLRAEARRIGPAEDELPVASFDSGVRVSHHEPLAPPRVVIRRRRMRGLSRIGKVASVLLAASLLIAVLAAVARYPFTTSNGTGAPTVVSPGAAIPDVPMPGANPARTNVQPGPGLTMLPEIKQQADVAGQSMSLADNVLVIVTGQYIRALDAASLSEIWTIEPSPGVFTAPSITDGVIYFGVTTDSEQSVVDPGQNQLVAISLHDGRELWRTDGAGVYPVNPLVVGDMVYSVGSTEQGYSLGAFRTSDGSEIWRSNIWDEGWCCFQMDIAYADGILVVNLPYHLLAVDATDGARKWTVTVPSPLYYSPPVIANDQVIINSGKNIEMHPGSGPSGEQATASLVAYDLQTGNENWRNESTAAQQAQAGFVPDANGVLYAGPWKRSDGEQLALLDPDSGVPHWTTPLPQVGDEEYRYSTFSDSAAPAIVADRAYVIGVTLRTGDGSRRSSVLSSVDLRTGQIQWVTQLDGGIIESPIISGGRIYVLTFDAGLYVLGDSTSAVTALQAVVDLRTPVTCPAEPSDSPLLGDLPATPTVPGVKPWEKDFIFFSQIPAGIASDIDPTVAAQLEQLFKDYRACSQLDPYKSVFGFFSTDYYVRLQSGDESLDGGKEQPWAVWMAPMSEFLTLDVNSLQALPDGRIGGMINSPHTNIYVWFVQEDGVWKIDEYHRVIADPVDPNAATPPPSTNAEGTPLG